MFGVETGNKKFVALKFWDAERDGVIIQSRREAAEKALGFRLNYNALWELPGFDVCVMVNVPSPLVY